MQRDYDDLIHTRHELVDGIGPWYWLKSDTGAWDGPKRDWEESHKFKWLEHVTDFDVCVQAGACQGMYPRLLIERFKRVYSFEPDSLNFHVAVKNCQRDDITIFNAAVGQESGTFTGVTRQFMDNVGMHQTKGEGSVPVMAIDSLKLPQCGLIALDIEGYELWAVQGAVETIRRCRPVVTLECPSTDTILLMQELGYVAEEQSVSDRVFIPSA